jgi:hypothetical protein
MTGIRLRSRWLLATTALLAFLLMGAGLAWACTIYYGQTTIENITTSSGEYTVVADNTNDYAMDRCDGAGSGSVFTANNNNGSDDDGDGTNDGDVIRVEIDEYSDTSNCNGDHSMAGKGPVYINVQDGYTYDDNSYDGDGEGNDDDVYEDSDDGNSVTNEPSSRASSERDYDCMGDGQGLLSDEINHQADPNDDDSIPVKSNGQFDESDADVTANGSADADGDGVNDVDIAIDPNVNDDRDDGDDADSDSDYAAGLCVSDQGGGDSAPMIPLVVN